MIKNTVNSNFKLERKYLLLICSLLIIVHITKIIYFNFQHFSILIAANFAMVLFILGVLFFFNKRKRLKPFLDQLIISETIIVFLHILFVWKDLPEVFIWASCITLTILLFYEKQNLFTYILFSTTLFVSGPYLSIFLNLVEYYHQEADKINAFYKQFLYINIVAVIILLIVITISFKKYIFINNIFVIKQKNSLFNENIRINTDINTDKATGKTEELKKLFIKIKNHVETEKKFLNPEYSLKLLSSEIQSNISYVSKSINSFSSYNFNDFINQYRIEYFKELLKHDKQLGSIKNYYTNCGFTQQSTFNRVFKQFEGITPSQFINQINK